MFGDSGLNTYPSIVKVPMTYEDYVKEAALEMYGQNLSSPEVARLLGEISHRTIFQWCVEEGVSRSLSESKCYEDYMKEAALEMYKQGLNSREVSRLLGGIDHSTIARWCVESDISRSVSKAQKGKRLSLETRKKISFTLRGRYGELSRGWIGDDAGYTGQHSRTQKRVPILEGTMCEICGEDLAIHRMRADATLFPLRDEYVILGCGSCNNKHASGALSITFINSDDGKSYCAFQGELLEVV